MRGRGQGEEARRRAGRRERVRGSGQGKRAGAGKGARADHAGVSPVPGSDCGWQRAVVGSFESSSLAARAAAGKCCRQGLLRLTCETVPNLKLESCWHCRAVHRLHSRPGAAHDVHSARLQTQYGAPDLRPVPLLDLLPPPPQ